MERRFCRGDPLDSYIFRSKSQRDVVWTGFRLLVPLRSAAKRQGRGWRVEDDGGLVSPEWEPGIRYRRVDVCTFFFF